jgi:hypothetical protein
MLNVHRDQLVVEEKGIYSIENFLTARRLMYWQVYLHKTTVSAERMVVNIIRRAQTLMHADEHIPASDALRMFLKHNFTIDEFRTNRKALLAFGTLDDNDLWGAIKCWRNNDDRILSMLSGMLLERKLFQIILSSDPIKKQQVEKIRSGISRQYRTLRAESNYLSSYGSVSNEAYAEGMHINIFTKRGELLDIAQASDLPNIKAFSKVVKKNYLCWPKDVKI